MSVPILTNFTI